MRVLPSSPIRFPPLLPSPPLRFPPLLPSSPLLSSLPRPSSSSSQSLLLFSLPVPPLLFSLLPLLPFSSCLPAHSSTSFPPFPPQTHLARCLSILTSERRACCVGSSRGSDAMRSTSVAADTANNRTGSQLSQVQGALRADALLTTHSRRVMDAWCVSWPLCCCFSRVGCGLRQARCSPTGALRGGDGRP